MFFVFPWFRRECFFWLMNLICTFPSLAMPQILTWDLSVQQSSSNVKGLSFLLCKSSASCITFSHIVKVWLMCHSKALLNNAHFQPVLFYCWLDILKDNTSNGYHCVTTKTSRNLQIGSCRLMSWKLCRLRFNHTYKLSFIWIHSATH